MPKSVYKNLLAILLLLAPVFVRAQRTFQFTIVDQATGKPLGDKWGTVIKNNIHYIDGVHSNKSGVCKFTDRKYDSTATYQFEIINSWNNGIQPAYVDISGVKTSAITVKLSPAKYKVKYTCGEVLYRNYYARQAFTMDSLPADIQLKVKDYLTRRIGDDFYKKLVLNDGQ